ncbi:MAG: hypothetical protein ACRDG4_13230 [Chloroflexota bacterium]
MDTKWQMAPGSRRATQGIERRLRWSTRTARLRLLAFGWALLYAAYRGYYALGGTFGMFGTPISPSQWRLINAVAAVLLVIAAVLPVATAGLWQRRHARTALSALYWVIAVGCVMHALVDITIRLLSMAGVLHMEFPHFASIDRRSADLQDLLFNEPWFLGEGLLWGVLGWMELTSARARRLWLVSGIVATAVLTVIGVLSAAGHIGRIIIG